MSKYPVALLARRGAKKVLVSQYGGKTRRQRNGWNIRSRRIRKRKRSGLKQPRRQMKGMDSIIVKETAGGGKRG
ncbi:MAG: hypothetical protein ACLR8P_13935 [Clostridium fessum]